MQTKLTLRINDKLIESAKQYAKQTGKPVSQIVADYFSFLSKKGKTDQVELPAITRSLDGILSSSGINEEDYHRHLEEKYL